MPTTSTRRALFAAAICLATALARPAAAPAATVSGTTSAAHAAARTAFEAAYPGASPLAKLVGRMSDAALGAAATDLDGAAAQADAAFALAIRYGTVRDGDAVREAAFARRLAHQLKDAPDESRAELLAFLRAHAPLAHTLAFAVRDGDDVPGVYGLLDRLRKERPAQLVQYPELAVALCVVRDRPLRRGINENTVTAADPVEVFDFFVTHERQMTYGLRGVPVELLTYVVDTTATIPELNWAASKYAGTRDVGGLFFLINYDYQYYQGKAEKKVDHAPGGYVLPNILKFGGVCADQAYFATSVGKAIGVPTAWTTGESGEMAHAWVGYLKSNGRNVAWDFDSGRYDAYQAVRGNVTDPQTGEGTADSTVGMLADLIGTNPVQRQSGVALIDAARALAKTPTEADPPAYPAELLVPPAPGRTAAPAPSARPATADGQLDLIEQGLRQYTAYPRGWSLVADLARDGKLTDAQKHKWADLTQRLCGQRHTDFALAMLEPMVDTVSDADDQSKLWDAVFKYVQARPDLAAEVRFRQAHLWETHDNPRRAGVVYDDVVHRYINAGPFAVRALHSEEAILQQLGLGQRVVALYAAAAKLVAKPEQMPGRTEFIAESNWYKVREAYAAKLAEAGQTQLADQIHAEDKGRS